MVLLFDQAVNGLVIGSIYALIALGFSLVFGVANLINFSQGSVLMVGAYAGWLIVTRFAAPLPIAFLASATVGAVLGALIERVGLRRLANAPAIAPLLSTIAIAMMLDNIAQIAFGPETQIFPAILPPLAITVGGVHLAAIDLLIVVLSPVLMTTLAIFLRRSRLGWAIRATAQDRDAAKQMGIDVDGVNMLSFAIAGALGGIAGLLVGMYFNSVEPTMGFQLSLKGFTAAMLGGITSIPGAVVGGVLLGLVETLAVTVFGSATRNMVAFLILLLVFIVFPGGLLGRRLNFSQAMPAGSFFATGARRPIPPAVVAAVGVAAILIPLLAPDRYTVQVVLIGLIFAVLALSLNLVSGTTGLVSLGHAGFFGIGAYACALLTRNLGLSFWLALPAAGVIAAVVGIVLVFPALRLRGHYVAIATLGIGEIILVVILNWVDVTRGPMGLTGIPRPDLFGHVLADVRDFYWLVLAVLVAVIILLIRVDASHLGRTLRGVRDDEEAAAAQSIEIPYYKTLSFAVSLFVAGLAGALYAVFLTFVGPEPFSSAASILVLVMVVLGGMDSIPGAIAGALVVMVLPEIFRPLADARYVVFGLAILLLIHFRPRGLLGTFR